MDSCFPYREIHASFNHYMYFISWELSHFLVRSSEKTLLYFQLCWNLSPRHLSSTIYDWKISSLLPLCFKSYFYSINMKKTNQNSFYTKSLNYYKILLPILPILWWWKRGIPSLKDTFISSLHHRDSSAHQKSYLSTVLLILYCYVYASLISQGHL